MRVIGIDPGISTTGYGVVQRNGGRLEAVAYGVVRTPPELPHALRLHLLQQRMGAVLAETRPAEAAIERLFFNSNVRTAMSVGQAAGVVLATLAAAGLDTCHYTPPEVKQAVVGYGSATKHQVQAMVARILRLEAAPSPADAADACALAVCHINRNGLTRAVEAAR